MAGTVGNLSMEEVEKLKKTLGDLKKKPKPKKTEKPEKVTKSKALLLLKRELIAAMEKKNYSVEEIAVVLKENGMEVSPLTINRALAEARKQGKRKTSAHIVEQK